MILSNLPGVFGPNLEKEFLWKLRFVDLRYLLALKTYAITELLYFGYSKMVLDFLFSRR